MRLYLTALPGAGSQPFCIYLISLWIDFVLLLMRQRNRYPSQRTSIFEHYLDKILVNKTLRKLVLSVVVAITYHNNQFIDGEGTWPQRHLLAIMTTWHQYSSARRFDSLFLWTARKWFCEAHCLAADSLLSSSPSATHHNVSTAATTYNTAG